MKHVNKLRSLVYNCECDHDLLPIVEEQLTSGSLEGVTRVMKAPLTLDEMYNNNEETRDELLWKVCAITP